MNYSSADSASALDGVVSHLVLTLLMLVVGESEMLTSDARVSFHGNVSAGNDLCKFSTATRDYVREIGGI